MGDSLITVVAIFLAAILMFVFPLMSMSERTDDISQLAIQTTTNEFVDKIRTTGKITLDEYDKFMTTLQATGNSYDIEMQVHQLDENPGVKVTQAEMTKIGENIYYTRYTSQIQQELQASGSMKLKEGDMVSVTVKNTNKTIAESLRNFFYQLTGDNSYEIAAKHSGIVTVNGSN